MAKARSIDIAFRCDASLDIGTGHLMRCLTLADQIQAQGGRCTFVCRHLLSGMEEMIFRSGHKLIRLDTTDSGSIESHLKHGHWLGASQSEDIEDTINKCKSQRWDWLVIDHYAIDIEWESTALILFPRILVIDDLWDRQHQCDLFLNQNLVDKDASFYDNLLPKHCKQLIGPRYALLREEFRLTREQSEERDRLHNALIFFGGVDRGNSTMKAVKAISELSLPSLEVNVVLGLQHPYLNQIRSYCEECDYHYHIQTQRMAQLMRQADIMIGAAGSTSWERCALGLPSIVTAVADNQLSIAQATEKQGASIFLGPESEVTKGMIAAALKHLEHERSTLNQMSRYSFKLCDGQGAFRVAQKIMASA